MSMNPAIASGIEAPGNPATVVPLSIRAGLGVLAGACALQCVWGLFLARRFEAMFSDLRANGAISGMTAVFLDHPVAICAALTAGTLLSLAALARKRERAGAVVWSLAVLVICVTITQVMSVNWVFLNLIEFVGAVAP